MKILFIQKTAGTGGAKQSLIETLYAASACKGLICGVITGEDGPFVEQCRAIGINPIIGSIPEWRKWTERIFVNRRIQCLATEVNFFKPDYVVSNEMWWSPHAILLARRLGCHSAAIVRDMVAVGPKARKYQLHQLDRILCLSEAMQKELSSAADLAGNSRVLYDPVAQPYIQQNVETEVRDLLAAFPKVKKWLLTVGSIGPRKNQIEAVRVLGLVHKAGLDDVGLILAGRIEKNYEPELIDVIARSRLEQFVCMPGHVNHVGNWIQYSQATLLTSRREGLPRSIIESLLLGRPCFSLPLPGLEEIYGEEILKFVSTEARADCLAPLLINGLLKPETLRESINNISSTLKDRFSPESHIRNLQKVLSS